MLRELIPKPAHSRRQIEAVTSDLAVAWRRFPYWEVYWLVLVPPSPRDLLESWVYGRTTLEIFEE